MIFSAINWEVVILILGASPLVLLVLAGVMLVVHHLRYRNTDRD